MKNKKRGISIMEVVVAILVITIISVSATTLALSSTKNQKSTARGIEIACFCENTIESFRFYDDYDQFVAQVKDFDSSAVEQNGEITVQKNGYEILIITDWQNNHISITATSEKGDDLYSISYTKGGAL
ncbi:MAG: hypothetical protein IJC07_05765 [Clostridia bacterium]|nr:hypothetical protein [Clostridia bacterium]